MRIGLYILLYLLVLPGWAVAADKQDPGKALRPEDMHQTFHRANEAYNLGEYEKATELYTHIIESGVENGHLYYNMGNCLIRTGQLGQGIAAFLKSGFLLPRDQNTQANLDYARKSIKDAVEPPKPSVLKKTLFFWHYNLNSRELLFLTALASILFWAGMIVRIYRRESETLRWIVVALLLAMSAFGSSLAVHTLRPNQLAVVAKPTVKVYSSSSRSSTVLFELHEGSEARLLTEDADWLMIRLTDGKRGWIKADGVAIAR